MKQYIKNRNWENISVVIEEIEYSTWLAFVMHWLWGFKEQEHIRTFIQSFLDNNITVISFDTTNSFGESDGNYEDATITNYYEDLEDVIEWTKTQKYYETPLYLAGHSLWWICTSLYAQKYPDNVKALAPISTVVSGQLNMQTKDGDVLDDWKRTWYLEKESISKPWVIKKLKWSHMEDKLTYDLLKNIDALHMPVLLIVWDKDYTTPIEHQEIFYKELTWEKELHIIKWAPHTFRKQEELDEIYDIFDAWIKKYS